MSERPESDAQLLHDSISQIASIRIQAELLMLDVVDPKASTDGVNRTVPVEGLATIVELTEAVQETLTKLLISHSK